MKLVQEKQPDMQIQNVASTGQFRIKNSAKAFKILSSGLYSNKIRAIVRELSCNAIDSHKEAGKEDVPFEIHLPNKIEPWLAIKDFGIGLDHEGVTDVYTTYFESTKTDSNEYIGALGLGSKSPFSYTDTFSVTAIKDGTKRSYSAYTDETGTPAISLMAELDTDEPNGVEVKFAVQENDFRRFAEEAGEVLKWFSNKPTVVGDCGFEIPEIDVVAENISPGVDIYEPENTYNSDRGAFAIQGNIPYPISIPRAQLADAPNYVQDLLDSPLIIAFEIGDLDIAASREELSYDDNMHTTNNILARMEQVYEDIKVYVNEQVAHIECQWLLADKLMKLRKQKLFRESVDNFIANGGCELLVATKYSHSGSYTISKSDVLNVSVEEFEKLNVRFKMFKVSGSYAGTTVRQIEPSRRASDKKDNEGNRLYENYWDIPNDCGMTIILNDTNRGPSTRIRDHFKRHGKDDRPDTILVLDTEKAYEDDRPQIYRRVLQRLLKPVANYMNVSQLYKKETVRAKIESSLMKAEFRKYRRDTYDPHWSWARVEQEEADEMDGSPFYYVPLSGHRVLNKDGSVKEDFFYGWWKYVVESGLFPDTLYGIRKSLIDDVKDDSDWINIFDYIADEIAKVDHAPFKREALTQVEDPAIMDKPAAKWAQAELEEDSPYRVLADAMQTLYNMKTGSTKVKCLYSLKVLLRHAEIDHNYSSDGDEIRAAIKEVKKAYPMLRMLSEYYSSLPGGKEQKEIFEYIKQTDMVRSMEK